MRRNLVLCMALLFWGITALYADVSAEKLAEKLSGEFAKVAEEVSPAVVSIVSVKIIQAPVGTMPFEEPFFDDLKKFFGDDFFKFFAPSPRKGRKYQQRGLGSGVIVSSDGVILTNNHVVGDADKIRVTLYDGREFKAEVKGKDPKTDLAVIKIKGRNLPYAKLGDSDKIKVGEIVLAIGNPFGLKSTVTQGIISAKGRSDVGIATYENFIQTDAAINPGNSGGPLVNLKGEVIGINTAIFTRSGGYMGVGFAIPINMAKSVMKQLLEKGRVIRGWLGVVIQPLTEELAESFGIKGKKGVLIGDVMKGSPAAKAGLKRGDIIIKFAGKKVDTPSALQEKVAGTAPGTRVKIDILRRGKPLTLTAKIAEMPKEKAEAKEKKAEEELGMRVGELTPELASKLGYEGEKGVLILEVFPGSIAEIAGLTRGDLIKEINDKKIESLNDYHKIISKLLKSKAPIRLLVKRGEYTFFTVIKVE
ncbi:MAG: DegQ family serine endoprotease [Caldiserica bacterium]|nr:DegQ family serine endoprotease [Caldisericota bacterium]